MESQLSVIIQKEIQMMNSKEELWASGIPALIIGIPLSLMSGALIRAFKSSKPFALDYEFTIADWLLLIFIAILPMLIIAFINLFRYYVLGTTEFTPTCFRNDGATKEKRVAMNKPVPKQLLSKKSDGWTVGKVGKKFIRIAADPYNILHGLNIGTPGSGKSSTLITSLTYNFNEAPLEERMTVFALDIKPELQRKSVKYDGRGKDIRVVNPASTSPKYFGWDVYYMLDENSTDDEVEQVNDTIARSLIVSKGNSDNEIFYSTARNLMIAFLIYGFFTGKGFLDSMLQLMSVPLQDLIAQIMTDKEICRKHPKIVQILLSYDGDKSEMLQDAQNTMRENLRIFTNKSVQYLLRDNPRKASPKNLTEDNISIFLELPDHLLDQYKPLFNLMTQQVLNHLSSIPEYERADRDVPIIWLLLDEFGSIGHINIEGPLARLRSRKVSIWLYVQSLAQLDDTYGQTGRRAIVSDCDCILVYASKDDISNKFFSDLAGNYEQTKIAEHRDGFFNTYSGNNVSTEIRPVFDFKDFMRLKKEQKIIGFIDGDYFYVDKCPYYQIPKIKKISDKALEYNHKHMPDGTRRTK